MTPLAVLCHRYRLLYIAVPGTGCSVVRARLLDELGGVEIGRKHASVPELSRDNLVSQADLASLTVVANIRNPFDRLVTYYQRFAGSWVDEYGQWKARDLDRQVSRGRLSQRGRENELVVLRRHLRTRRRRARVMAAIGFNAWAKLTILRWGFRRRRENLLFPMLHGVDIALRQERLEMAFQECLRALGHQGPPPLGVANLTPGKGDYRHYYHGSTRRLITRIHGEQLQRFGYSFDGVVDDRVLIAL